MIISLIRFFDIWILRGILFLLPCTQNSTPPTEPKNILFIRLWGMWSAVLSLPLLQILRKAYPNASINVLVTPNTQGIFTRTSLVNGGVIDLFTLKGVWQIIQKLRHYDLVIDTEEYFCISSLISYYAGKYRIGFDTMSFRKNVYQRAVAFNDVQHVSDTYLDLFRALSQKPIEPVESLIPIEFPLSTSIRIAEYIKGLPSHTHIIGIHPGGSTTAPERFWSVGHWILLCIGILSKYPDSLILITGTKLEKDAHKEIIKALEYSERLISTIGHIPWDLGTFAALLTHLDVYISNDSGPMHLSWAMGTPTVGLFGPNLPIRYEPLPRNKCVWLYAWNWVPTINVHTWVFKQDTDYLVDKISPVEVINEVENILRVRN